MNSPNTSSPPRTRGSARPSPLEFDAATHTYRTQDGRVVPNVTSILEPLQLFDFEDNPFITPEVLKAARDFGQHVHMACHLWNVGTLDLDTLDEPLLPYLAAWQAFLMETGCTITHSEQRIHHVRYGYAGTLDACGKLSGRNWLIDIKSGAVPWTVGFQTAAYAAAMGEMHGLEAIREYRHNRMAVQLLESGRYRIHEQKDAGDFQIFLSALNIYKAKARKRKPIHVSDYA